MKGHVKLTTAEHRAWRVNKAQWVSPQGIVLRAVTPEEEQAIFPFVERTRRTGRTETYSAKVQYKVRNAAGQIVNYEQPMDLVVRSTRTGRDAQAFLLDVFVNGNRYVKGREIIEKRMLAKHGECILFQPNGKRLRIIRNPKLARPTYAESQRAAPHPDHCGCRAFSDRREPGRHHIACEWNAKAPPHEQASPLVRDVPPTLVESPEPLASLAFDIASPEPVNGYARAAAIPTASPFPPPPPGAELPMRASGPVALSPPAPAPVSADRAAHHPTFGAPFLTVAPPLPAAAQLFETPNPRVGVAEVYAPEECPRDCRGARSPDAAWPWPAGRRPQRGYHHPLCPYESAHRQSLAGGQRWVLYDVERRVEVREASSQEVAQAEVELQRSGTRSVVVSGRIYAIVNAAAQRQPAQPATRPPAAPAYEQARQQALSHSGLPSVPAAAAPAPANALESELRARIAELERMMATQGSIGPGARVEPSMYPYPAPAAPPAQTYPTAPSAPPTTGYFAVDPSAALLTPRPVAAAADHLRNDKGLVGAQQIGDDIPLGRVELTEPEPFVDPLPAMRIAPQGQPAPYHPGGVHGDGFVPPSVPGAEPAAVHANDVISADLSSPIDEEAMAPGLDLGGPDDEGDLGVEGDAGDFDAAAAMITMGAPLGGFEPVPASGA